MKRAARWLWWLMLAATAGLADEDDDQPKASLRPDSSGAYALTQSQQQAVGLRIDHPMQMASPQLIDAYGLVLDPVALVTDAGRMDSTQAAADAAAADVARLDGLYRNNADASLKALQASRSVAIEAAAPRGAFVLGDEDAPVVLMSAGIGVTPVLAMLQAESAAEISRSLWWVHSARDGGHHPFAAEVRDRLHEMRDGRSVVFYSRPAPSDEIGVVYDIAGRLDLARLAADGMPMDAVFYLCGPSAFATALTSALAGMGADPARIRSESFGPAAVAQSGVPPHPPVGAVGEGPSVRFMRSGLSVPWDATHASLLELAEACDVPVRWSCRTGVCHNCECAVVDGELEYVIEPVDRPPDGRTLLCCAVPKSDVVLEL